MFLFTSQNAWPEQTTACYNQTGDREISLNTSKTQLKFLLHR